MATPSAQSELNKAGGERICCTLCGKSVSTPVPADTVITAWVECPACLDKRLHPCGDHGIGCAAALAIGAVAAVMVMAV